MICLPFSIAALVSQKAWAEIMCLSNWHNLASDYVQTSVPKRVSIIQDWFVLDDLDHRGNENGPPLGFTVDTCQFLANTMRTQANIALGREVQRLHCQSVVEEAVFPHWIHGVLS